MFFKPPKDELYVGVTSLVRGPSHSGPTNFKDVSVPSLRKTIDKLQSIVHRIGQHS